MFIYAQAVCIHIFLIFIICRIYGTFQLNAHKNVAENISRSLTQRFIFDSNGKFSGWTSWEHYAACSTTCVKEYENLTRACCDTGNNFFCYTIPWKNLSQYVGSCPVNGTWSSWSPFSVCDVTCGNGSKIRTRTCEYQPGLLHGSICIGNNTESQNCSQRTCPVDGVWFQWTSWSPCSVTCGGGTSHRRRDCYYQPRVPQGDPCPGSMIDTKVCSNVTCPVDGHFDEWSTWSACTVTCGGGFQSRQRTCVFHPSSAPIGRNCTGSWSERKNCNTLICEPITTTLPVVTEPIPTKARSCFQCLGPTNLCEKLNAPMECPIEKQYCINTLDNKEDASRVVDMRCGTRQECESGWFTKYAFNDRCTRFDQDFVYTNKIYCEFCCAKDDCNAKINPDDKWKP